ncbi:hypothetical protein I4U23_000087 [Adineta vaga]|nr:hypothetical protein I4U23_000087 [Adineta vaga]
MSSTKYQSKTDWIVGDRSLSVNFYDKASYQLGIALLSFIGKPISDQSSTKNKFQKLKRNFPLKKEGLSIYISKEWVLAQLRKPFLFQSVLA